MLYDEARVLVEQLERVRARVRTAAGPLSFTIGTLADTAELVGYRLVAAFRREHPHVTVSVHEADLADPTAGLRSGLVDVALTRRPFDESGLQSRVLSTERVGLVVHLDDPLARRASVSVADPVDRRWVRLPDGTDPAWVAYWTAGRARDRFDDDAEGGAGAVRTIQECLQSVLWNGATALAPLEQVLPPGLVTIPVNDRPPSELVLAWRSADATPLIRSFARTAAEAFRSPSGSADTAGHNVG